MGATARCEGRLRGRAARRPGRGAPPPLRRRQGRSPAPASVAGSSVPKQQLLVYVPPHPLVRHYLNMARNEVTPTALFRGSMAELGRILIYEATSEWLTEQLVSVPMNTPCGEIDAEFIDPTRPVRVVPILRAGLVLLENAASVLPVSTTHHLGYVRDEETLQPSMYLNKLPESFTDEDRVLLVDPMLATGGTMHAAVEECVRRGAKVKNIRCVVAVCAPPALMKLSDSFPDLVVYAGGIDPELNDKGFIIPGLGDAGDRCFGT